MYAWTFAVRLTWRGEMARTLQDAKLHTRAAPLAGREAAEALLALDLGRAGGGLPQGRKGRHLDRTPLQH